jgi:transcriptional regulator with XRE-family HTH domain
LQSSFTHTTKEIVGRKVKFFRKKNKLTQQGLGDLIDADRQYVWKVEHARISMSLDKLDRIIIALKCTQEDFLNITPNP